MNGNKNLIVLGAMTIFFALLTFATIWMWRPEMLIIVIFAQPMGNLVGALIGMLIPDKPQPPPGTTTKSASSVEQQTDTPATPKEPAV